jgi:transposase-like protein
MTYCEVAQKVDVASANQQKTLSLYQLRGDGGFEPMILPDTPELRDPDSRRN